MTSTPEPEFKLDDSVTERDLLYRIYSELKLIRINTNKALFAMHEAETEVPEKMRRFTMYMHELHDIAYMYEERGIPVPPHIHREMERCDDRLRQLLKEQHTDGGTFERIRREMAGDEENRWDHNRQLEFKRSTI